MKKRVTALSLCLMMVASLAVGCGNSSEEAAEETATVEDTSLADVLEKGELLVGMCPEYPPFESITESGEIEGFDVDLATAIGEKMGVKVTCVNTPWESLIASLNNGDFDIIMSGMSPEEATAAENAVNISDVYYTLSEVVVVPEDSEVQTTEDLAGKTIGCHVGSVSEQACNHLVESGVEATINTYNRHSEGYADMLNGNIDAVVFELPYAKQKVQPEHGVRILEDSPIQEFDLVAVMTDGSDELTAAYNKALQEVIDEGTFDEIFNKWFGDN